MVLAVGVLAVAAVVLALAALWQHDQIAELRRLHGYNRDRICSLEASTGHLQQSPRSFVCGFCQREDFSQNSVLRGRQYHPACWQKLEKARKAAGVNIGD